MHARIDDDAMALRCLLKGRESEKDQKKKQHIQFDLVDSNFPIKQISIGHWSVWHGDAAVCCSGSTSVTNMVNIIILKTM